MRVIDHFVAGDPLPNAPHFADILDPNNGGVQAQVALGNAAILDISVAASSAAQPAWAATNPQRRARAMFRFKERVEKNIDALANVLFSEVGKVNAKSKGDIQRGIESVKFWAKVKTLTQRWPDGGLGDLANAFCIPTMG